jgi:GrpB-like predicted nucleotidyltransferase (UPF0157 family)
MKIIIEDYTAAWINDFERERVILQDTLQGLDAVIEHIGSTSVPGLGAKPIIDILIGMPTEADLDKVIAPMQRCGYTYFKKYEPGMPYRRLFVKLAPNGKERPPALVDVNDMLITGQHFIARANIHVLVKDTLHWNRHIAFRDYLRAHPDVRDAYHELKKEISLREFRDTLEYNEAKNDFVKRVEQAALDWFLRH